MTSTYYLDYVDADDRDDCKIANYGSYYSGHTDVGTIEDAKRNGRFVRNNNPPITDLWLNTDSNKKELAQNWNDRAHWCMSASGRTFEHDLLNAKPSPNRWSKHALYNPEASKNYATNEKNLSAHCFAIHGYKSENKENCCFGTTNDMLRCASCWRPDNNFCFETLATYCTQQTGDPNNRTYKLFTEEKCKNLERLAPEQYEKIFKILATPTPEQKQKYNLNMGVSYKIPSIINYCKNKSGIFGESCGENIQKFCDGIETDSGKLAYKEACSCHMGNSFYEKIRDKMKEYLGPSAIGLQIEPKCLYPTCQTEGIPNDNAILWNTPCQSINACVNRVYVDNNGVINNIDINTSNECKFTNSNDANINVDVNGNDEKHEEKVQPVPENTPNPTPANGKQSEVIVSKKDTIINKLKSESKTNQIVMGIVSVIFVFIILGILYKLIKR